MKNAIRTLLLSLVLVPLIGGQVAFAKGSSNNNTPNNLGNDISYPQCSKSWPSNQAFGIVGVNGGLANTTNSCLVQQLSWATKSSGITTQSKVQLYVNTANPGGLNTPSWPTNNIDPAGNLTLNPYGICSGTNSLACAWQYGWNRSVEDVRQRFIPAAQSANLSTSPSAYPWWLDVETINTWQSGSSFANASNAADLEGMTAYFQSVGVNVGLYSTTYQWGQIAGSVNGGSNLNGLSNWRPGARNLSGAKSNCSLAPLTSGGKVVLTQYIANNLDYDNSCI
ncbi:MAG TPA: hypothetical protein VLE51_01060 [Candidatus Saccharimonadales bacterium]|nr:hypothetical protein [Candidatus Saccharimonadales bacterium]